MKNRLPLIASCKMMTAPPAARRITVAAEHTKIAAAKDHGAMSGAGC